MLSLTMPDRSSILAQRVLYAVPLLGALCIVPLVHSAYQVTGDPANALEANALAHLLVVGFDSHNNFLLLVLVSMYQILVNIAETFAQYAQFCAIGYLSLIISIVYPHCQCVFLMI